MKQLQINTLEVTRIPTSFGEFTLHLYGNNHDNREHLALVMGEVSGQAEVMVRLHSECYTGDVLGSLRCDCGEQLHRAMQMIAEAGTGVIIYLRQEGRGIGLLEKLRAYNLQDLGYDTVEANLLLGHQADERDYTIAVRILEELRIKSVQLLTNNPGKIDSLVALGMSVSKRIALHGTVYAENKRYIQTKIDRMAHFPPPLVNGHITNETSSESSILETVEARLAEANTFCEQYKRPYVTLTYAQTLDGCIALQSEDQLHISNHQSYRFTHQLRASHEAILVGIGTVLADDPRLTVRLVSGPNPQPIVLDSHLRIPLTSKLLHHPTHAPLIFTSNQADPHRQAKLAALGARVIRLATPANQPLNLNELLNQVATLGITRLMVEGGAQVITNFVAANLVDQLILTIAPILAGGLRAINPLTHPSTKTMPQLYNLQQDRLGDDMIIRGDMTWPSE